MARETRLTVGALFLVIAGLLVLGLDEAPDANKALLEGIFLVFLTAGFLGSVSGLLPGRASHPQLRMVFLPGRLVAGLVIALAGIFIVVLYYQVVRFGPPVFVAGAMLAVPVGLLFAASCWSEGCLGCGKPLEEQRIELHTDDGQALERAVRMADFASIRELQGGGQTGRLATLRLLYCSGCGDVAILHGPGGAQAALRGGDITRALETFAASSRPVSQAR